VEGDFSGRSEEFFSNGYPLFTRLKELYPDKFSFRHLPKNSQIKLSIKLDEHI